MKRLHDLGALLGGLGPGQSIVLHSACAEPKGLAGQLADSAHTAVAEMIDVVHGADVLAQLQKVADGPVEVFGG